MPCGAWRASATQFPHPCLQVPQLPAFAEDKALGHQANAVMLRVVADTAMPEAVRQVLGPWLVGQVTLARARLLLQLGSYQGCCSKEMLGGWESF